MFESIGRSFLLAKTSWGILMQDKKLLAFPLISGIISLIVFATFILPLFVAGMFFGTVVQGGSPLFYGILFLFYLASYFVVIFFNTALVSCVNASLNGRDMGIGEDLSNALRHNPAILAWALISATVGLLLQILEDKAGFIGDIAAAVIGGVWGLVTFFVVPVIVIEDVGFVDAMKESLALIKKTWGESIIGSGSIVLVFFLIGIVAFVLTLATMALGNATVFWTAVVLFIVLVVVIAVIAAALQGIFVTSLYQYAKTGTVPSVFDRDLIANAFRPKSGSTTGNI